MKLQPLIGLGIATILFNIFGIKMGGINLICEKTMTPFSFIWGETPKWLNVCFWFFIGCTLASSIVKMGFYHIVGFIYGMTPSTAHDDFWLYDYPINPINVPSVMIFSKPKDKTPEQMMDHFLKNIDKKGRDRVRVRCVVKFGKYFFKPILEGTPEY